MVSAWTRLSLSQLEFAHIFSHDEGDQGLFDDDEDDDDEQMISHSTPGVHFDIERLTLTAVNNQLRAIIEPGQ